MKFAIGLLVAFSLGAMCRWLDLPVPSPPRVAGVMLILAITLGYLTVDRLMPGTPASPERSGDSQTKAGP